MINGAHMVINSTDAAADRVFLRDVMQLKSVDAGDGWLIFALPASEIAVHPSRSNDTHQVYLLCESVETFISQMTAHGVTCDPINEVGWGRLTQITLPGGGKLGVYEPRHARPEYA